MKFLRWLVLLTLIASVIAVSYLFFLQFFWHEQIQSKLLSGLSGFSYLQKLNTTNNLKDVEIWGFLPYWTMNDAIIPSKVNDVAYFALIFNGQGNLVEKQDGALENGYARLRKDEFTDWLNEQTKLQRRTHITIVGSSNDDIAQLVTNQTAKENFIAQVSQLLVSYPFSGVQLDFEYVGNADSSLQQKYAEFLKELHSEIKKIDSKVILSVAVFGSSASKDTDFWDIKAMAPHVDRLIIMSYDYHVRSSDVAGPVAPLFGKETGRYEDDITSNLRDFLLYIEPEKILLGIPFYGYEWQVTKSQPGAATYPQSGSTATYKRVKELLENPDLEVEEGWDAAALSPYVAYSDNGKKKIIYFDNPRSLSYKLDLVNQLGLRGIAIWALGYEGEQSELWEVVGNKLRATP